MLEPALIGLDLGTSSCKAVAFTTDGRRLAESRVAYPTRGSGIAAEQQPEFWVSAALDCLAGIARQVEPESVVAIGLSGQIGTHLLVDVSGRPLADAVTWQDGRSGAYLAEVAEAVPDEWLTAQLDTQLPPGPAWPLPRLCWLRAELPELLERARYLLYPKDYLVWRLTGSPLSDPSSWRGIARPDGSVLVEALQRLGLPDLVPPLAAPDTTAGGLTTTVATTTGLLAGTPVVTGLNDLNAGLLGIGAVRAGAAFDIGGTSEHLGFVARERSADWRVAGVPLHAVDSLLYSVYGVTSNAGSVVTWLERAFLADGQDYSQVAGTSRPGASGLLCIPYLHGERAPIWDARATGAFLGLTNSHGPADFVRAALEGVACNLRAIRESIPAAAQSSQPIRTTGGTSRSAVWNSIKAAVLQRPLQLLAEPEAPALGAAILAGTGVGIFGSTQDACAAMVRTGPVVEPAAELVGLYEDVYLRYTQAAALVRELRQPS